MPYRPHCCVPGRLGRYTSRLAQDGHHHGEDDREHESAQGEEPTGTDAEACAYLMTVSLTQPMDSDWSDIYLYVAGQTYLRHKQGGLPDDIRVESLRDDQVRDLDRLKAWLYRQRTIIRLERERTDRRERKEADVAEREALQPALFEF
jgi:hypothetical protein